MSLVRQTLRTVACALALAATLLAWTTPARADALSTLVTIVQKMESAGVSPFPVKSGEIIAAKSLFECIKKDSSAKGVAGCLYAFSETPQGKKLLGPGATIELPPWLEKVIQAYIHIQEGDFWAVVDDLGEAAICIVAQVMAAGLDVCGLIKDLIAVGEALLDAGKAVAKFLAAVGGGAVETVKAVGCSLGLGGCGSAPPPEKVAYVCAFAPHVQPEGLARMEDVSPYAFDKFRGDLVKAAKSGVPCPQYLNSNYKASTGAADKAAEIFTSTVEGVWTGHILSKVLAKRDEKRINYPTASQLASLGAAATAEYDAKKADPVEFMVKRCAVDDFGNAFGFAHVDRWLLWRQPGQTKAQQEALKVPNVSSNRDWCKEQVFQKNVAKFAEQFRAFAKAKYCPEFGQQLSCQVLDKYHACVGLMKSVGQAAQCQVNVASLGKEVAGKVAEYFASKGTKHPCQIVLPDGGSFISSKPVVYSCTRATHKHFCELKYHSLWKGPPEVLDCAAPKLDPDYAALAAKVKLAVKDLQSKYPGVGIDKVDPLMVHSGSNATFAALKPVAGSRSETIAAVNFTFVLAGQLTIDGYTRPTMVADLEQQPLQVGVPASLAEHVAPVKPGDPDPFAKPGQALFAGTPALAAGAGPGAAGAPTKPLSAPLPAFTSGLGAPGRQSAPVGTVPLASALRPGNDQAADSRLPLPNLRPPAAAPAQVGSRVAEPQRSMPETVRAPQATQAPAARLPAVQSPQAPPASEARLPAVQSPQVPPASEARSPPLRSPQTAPASEARLPAVQSPHAVATPGARYPAVQSPQVAPAPGTRAPEERAPPSPAATGVRVPAVQAPPSPAAPVAIAPTVPAPPVQAPSPATRAATGPAGPAPNWNAMGQAGVQAPVPAAPPRAPAAAVAAAAPNVPAIQRDLASVSCTAPGATLRFTCTTRAGFDRCEAMRKRSQVDECILKERR